MALKTVLDTLEGVDDAVKALYAEKDGKFILDLEGIDMHPEVENLRNAHQRVKDGSTTLKAELATIKTQLAEAQKDKPDVAGLQAKLAAAETARQEAETKFTQTSEKLVGVTRDRTLADALQGSGVTNPSFLRAAQAMLGPMVKFDGDTAFVDTQMGPKLLPDYVKSWTAGDGKDFVSPPTGGGAKGNTGGATGLQVPRSQFNTMSQGDRAALAKSGGTVVDG